MPTTSRAIRAGKALVEILVDDRTVAPLRRIQRRLERFGSGLTTAGFRTAAAASAVFAPIGIAAIAAASDAEEGLSRFNQVFGDQAAAAAATAEEIADRIGRSSIDIKDSLGTFQSFLLGLEFDPARARELSSTLAELALDFASFNNLSDDEALQRFISALSGSGEVLDRFGINIKAAALEAELLALGIDKSAAQASEQEKALARLSIIARTLGKQGAVGDATRTAGSFANQMKRLRAELKDAAISIGQALLPVATKLVGGLTRAAAAVSAWTEANPRLVRTIFAVGGAVAAIGAVLLTAGVLATVAAAGFGALATVVPILGAALGAILTPAAAAVATVSGLGFVLERETDGVTRAARTISTGFGQIFGVVRTTVDGAVAALESGDLETAGRIATLGLELVFLEAKDSLYAVWDGLTTDIGVLLAKLAIDAQSIFISMVTGAAQAGLSIASILARAAGRGATAVGQAIGAAQGGAFAFLTGGDVRGGFITGGVQGGLQAQPVRDLLNQRAAILDILRGTIPLLDDALQNQLGEQLNALEKIAAQGGEGDPKTRARIDLLRNQLAELVESARRRDGAGGPGSADSIVGSIRQLITDLQSGQSRVQRAAIEFAARGTFSSLRTANILGNDPRGLQRAQVSRLTNIDGTTERMLRQLERVVPAAFT